MPLIEKQIPKCRIHDSDRSGTINFVEFQRLHVFLTNMQKSYQHFDADRNGELDENEIRQALQHAGEILARPTSYGEIGHSGFLLLNF